MVIHFLFWWEIDNFFDYNIEKMSYVSCSSLVHPWFCPSVWLPANVCFTSTGSRNTLPAMVCTFCICQKLSESVLKILEWFIKLLKCVQYMVFTHKPFFTKIWHHAVTLQGCSQHQNLGRIQRWPLCDLLNFQISSRSSCLEKAICFENFSMM